MGAEWGEEFLFQINLFKLTKKIESIIKNKSDSYIEQIVNELESFLMSEKFFNYFHFLELRKVKKDMKIFVPLGITCELNERYLFIKCLFPLLEKIINLKFENHLNKLENLNQAKINENENEVLDISNNYKDEYNDFIEMANEYFSEENKIFKFFTLIFQSFIFLLIRQKFPFIEFEEEKKILFYFYLFELNKKIESLIKNKSDSYVEQIINELSSFLMSENFLNFSYFVIEGEGELFFESLVLICEANERFLFLKCLFTLLEKLILKFETHISKLKNYNPQKKKEDYLKELIKQMK